MNPLTFLSFFSLALLCLINTAVGVSIPEGLPGIIQTSITNDVMPFLEELEDNSWSQKEKEAEFSKITQTGTSKTGLQYKSLTRRHFPVFRNIDHDSYVEVNHKTVLLDQTSYTDTWQKGSTSVLKVSELFRGWKEALGYMKEGDILLFYIPSRLAFGSQKVKDLPPNSDFIMYIELVKLNAEPSLWHKAKEFMDIDIYHPYMKVYHVFVIGAYLIFRRVSNRFIQYLVGGSKSKGKHKAKARHILFDKEDKALCEKVFKELSESLDSFEELAKEHSKCPSGKTGGELGWFKKGAMVAEFDKIVFDPKTELNTPLGPVQTQFGYHLIVIDDRKLPLEPVEKKKTK